MFLFCCTCSLPHCLVCFHARKKTCSHSRARAFFFLLAYQTHFAERTLLDVQGTQDLASFRPVHELVWQQVCFPLLGASRWYQCPRPSTHSTQPMRPTHPPISTMLRHVPVGLPLAHPLLSFFVLERSIYDPSSPGLIPCCLVGTA